MPAIQAMLAALVGGRRVTIGQEPLDQLRRLSDSRAIACPLCRAPVVLRAGAVLAPHFAHLPGAVCAHPHAEPETDTHRAGKALLAAWLCERLPDAGVLVEASLPATGQRADVLIETNRERIAIEYQCADLTAREWRRRHSLYRQAGIRDLWILGGGRLALSDGRLRPGDLERAMLWDRAPLLFLDSLGDSFDGRLPAGTIARFRAKPPGDLRCVQGRLSVRPLADLAFPWRLLDWPRDMNPPEVAPAGKQRHPAVQSEKERSGEGSANPLRLWLWLRIAHGVKEEELPALFGMPVFGAEAFDCTPRLWQACVYYRWIHRRVGDSWWIEEVNVWARRHLPLSVATGRLAYRALSDYQMLLSAAGFLSIPYGKGRAQVIGDLTTLEYPPDPEKVARLAAYRRTIKRDEVMR